MGAHDPDSRRALKPQSQNLYLASVVQLWSEPRTLSVWNRANIDGSTHKNIVTVGSKVKPQESGESGTYCSAMYSTPIRSIKLITVKHVCQMQLEVLILCYNMLSLEDPWTMSPLACFDNVKFSAFQFSEIRNIAWKVPWCVSDISQ